MFGGTGYKYTQCTPHPFSPNINLASTGQAYMLVFLSYSLLSLFSLSLYSSVFLSPLPFLFLFLIFFIFLVHFLFLCFFRRCFGSRSPNQPPSVEQEEEEEAREKGENRQTQPIPTPDNNQPQEGRGETNHRRGRQHTTTEEGEEKKKNREGGGKPTIWGKTNNGKEKKKTPRGGPLLSAQSGHRHHSLRNNWLFNNLIQNCICGNTAFFCNMGRCFCCTTGMFALRQEVAHALSVAFALVSTKIGKIRWSMFVTSHTRS